MIGNCSEFSFKIIQMKNFLLTKFKVPIGHCLHSETRTYIKLNVSGSYPHTLVLCDPLYRVIQEKSAIIWKR